jgi:hypothetical protein
LLCWDSPTHRSYQIRETYANTKFIAKSVCHTVIFVFSTSQSQDVNYKL